MAISGDNGSVGGATANFRDLRKREGLQWGSVGCNMEALWNEEAPETQFKVTLEDILREAKRRRQRERET